MVVDVNALEESSVPNRSLCPEWMEPVADPAVELGTEVVFRELISVSPVTVQHTG